MDDDSWPTYLEAYKDPNHPGNGPKYKTGELCISGCGREAGTYWSSLWCFECNVARMDKISRQLNELVNSMNKDEDRDKSDDT